MKRIYSSLLAAAMVFVFSAQPGQAQNDLNIFGYFQTTFTHIEIVDSVYKPSNSFAVQQLNVFLNKDFNDDFSAFINIEVLNNFSSERNWGGLNLEEAWMKYSASDAFNVKAGLLIPRFNALNEIKNKTPLLPYIRRPLAYEASMGDIISLEPYIPQRAFLQVYGNIGLSDDAKMEYAAYAGNADRFHINGGTTGQRGVDTTTYKLVGGRVGVTVSDFLRAGVSGTYDRQKFIVNSRFLGEMPRTRLGADLALSYAGFELTGELVLIDLNLADSSQAVLDSLAGLPNSTVGTSPKKTFYFANLTYNFNPQLYAYVGYSYMQDDISKFIGAGLGMTSFGVGYRPIDQVVLKAQFTKSKFGDNPVRPYDRNYYYVGASVFF